MAHIRDVESAGHTELHDEDEHRENGLTLMVETVAEHQEASNSGDSV